MFVFKQVARIGVNDKMPLELYLASNNTPEESWVVGGVFEDECGRVFYTIVDNNLSWKLDTSTMMFDGDTFEDMFKELGVTAVVKSV